MIEKRPFGRTEHWSTRTIFGAAALARVSQEEADQTFELLQSYDVNHIDVAASYGDAELRVGPWMENHRQDFFLATKTEERTYDGAWAELQRSLERLRTDHVDLWQMHILVDTEEWETAMGPNGALNAFIEARDKGLVRFLGVTGHGVEVAAVHLRSLERFDFDTVLLPYSYTMMQNTNYGADFDRLLDVCRERNVAVQTIKSLVRAPWGDRPPTRATWYEPLEEQADIDLAVHWVLDQPEFFLNTVGDIHILPKVLDAASRYVEGPSDAQMASLIREHDLQPLFV
jgi:aryl-alcohol dehydrogenase-like predicted oxidoreductase